MKVRVITVSQRQPDWVQAGADEYARRLPREWAFQIAELKPVARTSGVTVERAKALEAERIAAAVPKGALVVALDERGSAWSTADVASRLQEWSRSGRDLVFVIGGADGLDASVRQTAAACWSLSPATMPHGLVRIVLTEQLYRAWSLASGHPYHRA